MTADPREPKPPRETVAQEPSMMPGQIPPLEHSHPRRHQRALRSALTLAFLGMLVFTAGAVFLILDTRNALLVSLMVIGITMLLLSPVWYFTYMERLEPELYSPDTPEEDEGNPDQEKRS